jgi:L-lactate dehydrogenase complex protein LldG
VNTYLAKDEDEATTTVLSILKAVNATRVLAWADTSIGLPALGLELAKASVEVVPQEVPFDQELRRTRVHAMESAQAGITGAAAGLADTGSLVLTHGPSRGRLASLLPPVHIAVLRRSTIASTFGELLERQPSLPEASSNLVLITGPSRTADIEQTLSRGVHGPKDVHIILL